MALVHIDGCDFFYSDAQAAGAWGRWNSATSAVYKVNSGAFQTGGAINVTSATGFVRASFPSSAVHVVASGWFMPTSWTLSKLVYFANSGASQHCAVCIDGSGKIGFARAGTTILQSTADTVLTRGKWYFIAVRVYINDTVGTCEVLVDDTPVLVINGDTNNATDVNAYYAYFGGIGYWDDMAVWANGTQESIPSPYRIRSYLPDADGTPAQWVPSTGTSHTALVAKSAPTSTTTYVSTVNVNDVDTYSIADTTMTSISAVAANVLVTRDAGDATTANTAVGIDVGGTLAEMVPAGGAGTTQSYLKNLRTTDPSGAAWTPTSVNGIQVKIRRNA